jgi:hypothetical protein
MSLHNGQEMTSTFKLPMLPGNTCGEEMLRRNFRKTQVLSGTGEKCINIGQVPIDFDSTAVAGTTQLSPSKGATFSSTHASALAATAGKIAGDGTQSLERRVLRFYGHFSEGVHESPLEKVRVRPVILCFFLEDDTLSVSEPKQDNSGMAFQGTMVKRHQVQHADGRGLIAFQDLAVGSSISFYGRTYTLNDCDVFTREFMSAVGMELAGTQTAPVDGYSQARKPKAKNQMPSVQTNTNANGMKVKLSAGEVRATKQFLKNDRLVLRNKVVWDDSTALYGAKRFFTLYYFLSDDTIELVEDVGVNDGRDPFPSFCRRQRVMKNATNATGLTFGEGKGTATTGFYNDSDMVIGNSLTVFGRKFLIYDYDSFTKSHVEENFGVTNHTPIVVADPAKAAVRRDPPPYNGFGSEEDSLASWRSLSMRPARPDATNVKYGDASVKFALKLDNGVATDDLRTFVLTCFITDSTIAIFETVTRNSGITGGKFLQRQKMTNPATGKGFIAEDFYVGQKVTINSYKFRIDSTDERSMTFMEQNSSKFALCNINTIVHKVQAMLVSSQSGLADAMLSQGSLADHQEWATMFKALALPVCEQEVLTVLRFFDRNEETALTYAELIARLLSGDVQVNSDERSWDAIHGEMIGHNTANLSVKAKVDRQHDRVEATTAAYAARAFLESYANHRHQTHTEFKFVTDYSVDGKIGAKEFKTVVAKLNIGLNDPQVAALSSKIFPSIARRVTFDEFVRIMNNSSNFEHNMEQVKNRR